MNQVEEDESFITSLEEEAIEVECLLVEPQNDHVSVDGILCFHKENLEKCMEIEDVPCSFDCKATGEGKDALKLKVLDDMPHGIDEGNLQAENGFSTTCEDYLLDIGFAESVANLDYDSNDRLHLRDPGSESHIPGFSRGDIGTLGLSDSSTAIILVPECQNNLLNKTICELHGNFSCKCESETSVEAKWLKCPTSSETLNDDKLKDVSNLLVSDISSDKNEKGLNFPHGFTPGGMSCFSKIVENSDVRLVGQGVETESFNGRDGNVGALLTHKRLRKPTRRYIDESSDLNSRYRRKKQEISTSTSKDKFLGVRFLKHRHVGSRELTSSSKESLVKAIQVPFDSQGQKECSKKHASVEEWNTKYII